MNTASPDLASVPEVSAPTDIASSSPDEDEQARTTTRATINARRTLRRRPKLSTTGSVRQRNIWSAHRHPDFLLTRQVGIGLWQSLSTKGTGAAQQHRETRIGSWKGWWRRGRVRIPLAYLFLCESSSLLRNSHRPHPRCWETISGQSGKSWG